jgi:alpha-L-fucosidase
MRILLHALAIFAVFFAAHSQAAAPIPAHPTPLAPFGAIPTERQLRWHELEQYAFVHFGVDTFTDREWGFGDENPALFNPTAFDARQIATAAKAGGLKGLILVAKHHDGLCLWPTKSTAHNISATRYKDGKGDIVREMADACKRAGIKFGVYVSPWDRNHPDYGGPGYVAAYHQQIAELTSNYGPIFEMWFDGASGGDGYYGGKGGRRSISYNTYYGWKEIHAIIRKNQPGCAIWCGQYDEGGCTHYADCRWGGSEEGFVNDPCWNTLSSTKGSAGGTGFRGGDAWCPAEGDVSIRPGWFWHVGQNGQVKSPEKLMDVYLSCVGRGANLILNIPPDRRGLVHENDMASLAAYGEHLRKTFAVNLAQGARIAASNTRGKDPCYGPQRMLDADRWSAWITDDDVTTPDAVFELTGQKTFNLIRLREDIRLGQRVEGVAVDVWSDGTWKEIATAGSIGANRLWRVSKTTTAKARIRVTKSPVCPALSDFGLFLEPEFEPWIVPIGGNPKAAAKAKWKVISASFGDARAAIDGDPATFWNTHPVDGERNLPQEFAVDLGDEKTLKGFTYLPRQDGCLHGTVDRYALQTSLDGKRWKMMSEGEFGNLRANPVEQTITFAVPVRARYFKFIATHCLEKDHAIVAEIGIIE